MDKIFVLIPFYGRMPLVGKDVVLNDLDYEYCDTGDGLDGQEYDVFCTMGGDYVETKLYMPCDMYYKMQDEFIRQLLTHAAAAESYRKGCYQNKIDYIVRRLHR